jgi:hypothetical protein
MLPLPVIMHAVYSAVATYEASQQTRDAASGREIGLLYSIARDTTRGRRRSRYMVEERAQRGMVGRGSGNACLVATRSAEPHPAGR